MAELYPPSAAFQQRAYVKSMEEYSSEYERSVADPDAYWGEKAGEFHWYEKWQSVSSFNYDMDQGPISVRWFDGGKTSIAYNCLDRHLEKRGDQIAIIWEGNEPREDATITYRDLHQRVCKLANVLK